MKKTVIALIAVSLVLTVASAQNINQSTQDTDFVVEIVDTCSVDLFDYQQPGYGEVDPKTMALGNSDYFTGAMVNSGNQDAEASLNISVTKENTTEVEPFDSDNLVDLSDQPGNYSFEASLSGDSSDGYEERSESFISEFVASMESGNYTGRAEMEYSCNGDTETVTENRTFRIITAEGEIQPDQDEEADTQIEVEEGNQVIDPSPVVAISMRPLNSTYSATPGQFTEIPMEIENVGRTNLTDLSIEPRFPEDLNWESQELNIDSLEINESLNESVYVNPGEEVEGGMYQVPIYASDSEDDVGIQYIDVEVPEDEVFETSLIIDEAPQNIRFENGENYTIPMLLENQGLREISGVEIDLQNAEACGEYTTDNVDEIGPESTESAVMPFEASEELNECSATIVASADSGDMAFSEIEIEIVEEEEVVPEEFTFPIVASMWTIMLLAYAILTRRYGVQNMTVKMPLVLLVVGEAFILIYLSSVYYDLMPPGLLPF